MSNGPSESRIELVFDKDPVAECDKEIRLGEISRNFGPLVAQIVIKLDQLPLIIRPPDVGIVNVLDEVHISM